MEASQRRPSSMLLPDAPPAYDDVFRHSVAPGSYAPVLPTYANPSPSAGQAAPSAPVVMASRPVGGQARPGPTTNPSPAAPAHNNMPSPVTAAYLMGLKRPSYALPSAPSAAPTAAPASQPTPADRPFSYAPAPTRPPPQEDTPKDEPEENDAHPVPGSFLPPSMKRQSARTKFRHVPGVTPGKRASLINQPSSPSIIDKNGNPVVFFEVPQAQPSPPSQAATRMARPERKHRPSGLVETINKMPDELRSDIHLFEMENYAKHYFRQQRKGLFRRAVSLGSLLEWTKELATCLLNNLPEEHAKTALELFKVIQMYMGDRPRSKAYKSSVDLAQYLATVGGNTPPLRDEIYCQLIKQVTLNPSVPSTMKGWELMAIAIDSFPCTKNLEPYVRSFLHESALHVDTSRISVYAAYCLRRYDARWKHNTVVRVPSRQEIRAIQKNPFWGAMFGGTLEEMMEQQRERYPNVRIPRVLAIICDCVMESGGQDTEGIFRITAPMDQVYELKVQLEKGVSALPVQDNAHVPACLLKTWVSELREAIIPPDLYPHFMANENRLQALSDLIFHELPDVNRNSLLYLLRFLRIIGDTKNQAVTRMGLNNLALIFSPNVFKCPEEDPMTQLQNTKIESSILELLLKELSLPDSIPGVYVASSSPSLSQA